MAAGHDLLVKLYDLPAVHGDQPLRDRGIEIKRAFAGDREQVLAFVGENFGKSWVNECAYSLCQQPIRCFIAVQDKQILGFACYDATAMNFFGPTGVREDRRGQGIGRALLLRCLYAMREEGFAYAIIGWVGDALPFYQKTVGATIIENSHPGEYKRMIDL